MNEKLAAIDANVDKVYKQSFLDMGDWRQKGKAMVTIDEIPPYMFYKMTEMKEIYANSALRVGKYAFSGITSNAYLLRCELEECRYLGEYAFSGSKTNYVNGKYYNKDIEGTSHEPRNDFLIPKVEEIGKRALASLGSINHIYLPNLKKADEYAFYNCGSCISVIANNLQYAEKNLLGNMAQLRRVQLGEKCLTGDQTLAKSNLLTDESIQNIIDALAELTGEETYKISFHTDVLAKLTKEQIAQITAKNWTVG